MFKVEDAMALSFADNTFDGAIIRFGLRNLINLEEGMRELHRVVKPGGYVCNIDQGKPKQWFLRWVYAVYFYHIAPVVGKILFHMGEFNSFRYLPYSNRYFPDQEKIVTIFSGLGFEDIQNKDFICGAVACQTMRVKK